MLFLHQAMHRTRCTYNGRLFHLPIDSWALSEFTHSWQCIKTLENIHLSQPCSHLNQFMCLGNQSIITSYSFFLMFCLSNNISKAASSQHWIIRIKKHDLPVAFSSAMNTWCTHNCVHFKPIVYLNTRNVNHRRHLLWNYLWITGINNVRQEACP